MKTIALILTIIPLGLFASQPRLTTITLPLWYLDSAADNQEIVIAEVPKIYGSTSAEGWIALFSSPTFPDGAKTDINLISIYKIQITAVVGEEGKISKISIDTSQAIKPEAYPFTIQHVAETAAKCVRMEFSNKDQTKIFLVQNGIEKEYVPASEVKQDDLKK
jgi:hypothetical protein